MDGARKTDGGEGMSAPAKRAMVLQSAKVAPMGCKNAWDWAGVTLKHRYLKINNSLQHLAASYSDHPYEFMTTLKDFT